MSDSLFGSDPASGPGPRVTQSDDAITGLSPARGRRVDKLPRKFGRYRIQDCLGRGGMGAVFRAHDTQLDRTVALKVPFLGDGGEETRQRFFREARAAATLHHANICPVYDVGEEHGLPYLTMAFIEGRSLADVVAAGPPPAPVPAALLVRKLALAMQEAHAKGIVHRDLKPANVIIRPGGDPVIMDFGLARRGDDRATEGLTRQGDVIGTLEYMPPEQLDGDNAAVGPRADVYALGVVLYELLTGRRPFTGNTVRILAAILLKPPPKPSDGRPGVPPRLDDICLKAMARDPADRYASMADFAAALAEFVRTPGSGTVPPPVARPAEAPPTPPVARLVEAPPTPRPGPSTRPIRATVVPEAPAAPAVEPVAVPDSAATSSARRKKSGSRRKKPEARSNRPLVIGGVAAGVIVVALVAVLALRPRSEPKVAHQSDPTPPAAAPTPPPREAEPTPEGPAKAKPAATSPKQATAPVASAAPAVRLRPEAVSLAVGEAREVALDVQWHGYTGPLTVRWDAPPGLRVSPVGPLSLKPGDPAPKLTLRLMAEPTGMTPALTVTATPAPDAHRDAVAARLPVAFTPGPCTRIIEVAERTDAAAAMAFTPDASLALVGVGASPGSDAHPIRVWDIRRGEPLTPLAGHAGRVTQVVVSGDGKTALSVGADETVARWDLARGKRDAQTPRQPLPVLRTAVAPDGRSALAVYPKVILKVNLETLQPYGRPINTSQLTGSDLDAAVQAVAVSADRKGLVGGLDGKLVLLDLTEKARPKTLAGHTEAVRCAAFAPGGGLAATGGGGVLRVGELRPGKDNAVCVWDTAAGTLKWRAEGHAAPVVSVAFDPAGRHVASGGADGEVRVWDAADGRPVAAFKGHAGRVLALAFTPDGTALASGAADGTVRLWRLP